MLFGRPSREGPCALRRAVRLFRFAQRLRRCRSALDDTLCRRRRKFGRKRILAIAVIINRIFVVYVYTLIFLERPDSVKRHIAGRHGKDTLIFSCSRQTIVLIPSEEFPNAVMFRILNIDKIRKCNLLTFLQTRRTNCSIRVQNTVGRHYVIRNIIHAGSQLIVLLGIVRLQGDVLLRHLEGSLILTDVNIIRRPAVEGIAFLRRCRCESHRVAIPVQLLLVRLVRFTGIYIVVFIDIGNLFREVLNLRRCNRNIGLRVLLVVLVAQACARVGQKGCSVRQSILVVLNIERERLCLVAELVRNIPCHSLVVSRRRDHGVGRVRFI